jgi:glycosyltransferase involved in cell wall biosynthesis
MQFTILTPTYNAAHTLPRVYHSLQNQTEKDFEWLIVDDGSTDETATLVRAWQEAAIIPIRYISQENQGKYWALNTGIQAAEGEFLVPLDADDACVPTALAEFTARWEEIPVAQRPTFSGVCVLCEDQYGKLCGDPFPQDGLRATSSELAYRYQVAGEKWGFHRTDILKQFLFPDLRPCKFIPESYLWQRIAQQYQLYCCNTILRIYYVDEQPNNLSRQLHRPTHAAGRQLYYHWVLNHELHWFWSAPILFLKAAVHYGRLSRCLGIPMRHQWAALTTSLAKTLWAIGFVLNLGVVLKGKR